jgi:hypothetical protein
MNPDKRFIGQEYTKPIHYAIGQIVVAAALGLLALDFGALARQVGCMILLYSTLAAFVIFRRPFAATNRDLFVVKYAFAMIFGIVFTIDILFPAFYEWFNYQRHR